MHLRTDDLLTFGAQDSEEDGIFTRQIDSIEVWDRMPLQSACLDTCISLGFECGSQVVCGQAADCGSCAAHFSCSESKCCHASDTDLDGCVETEELTPFIARWKASSNDVSMIELLEAIREWKSGC